MARASQNGTEELMMKATLSGRSKNQPENKKKAEGKQA